MLSNLLITGGAGGIGSILANRLAAIDFNVDVLDDLSSGLKTNLDASQERLTLVSGDITDLKFLETLPWEKYDHVVHLAAMSSLPECQKDPVKAFKVNFLGTANIVSLAKSRSKNLKTFVNASTSAVYEGLLDTPFTEDMKVSPHLVYPLSKYMSETYVSTVARDYRFPAVSLRFFNVFGHLQDSRRQSPPLVNYIVRELLHRKSPVLHSNGLQVRDYIYVEAVVDAIEAVLRVAPSIGETYNVCTGTLLSVSDIYAVISDELNSGILPTYKNAEALWDNYSDLFDGPYPLNRNVVLEETTKSSQGSNKKFIEKYGWDSRQGLLHEDLRLVVKESIKLMSDAVGS